MTLREIAEKLRDVSDRIDTDAWPDRKDNRRAFVSIQQELNALALAIEHQLLTHGQL